MKRYEDRIEKTEDDKPCHTCANNFRACPMMMVLAMSRVPAGMEVAVMACPDYRELGDEQEEKERAGKTIGGLVRN